MPTTQPSGWPRGITAFEQRAGNAVTRVVTAVVGIPIIIGAVIAGGWAFFAFVALVGAGALMEFYWLVEQKGAKPNKVLGVIAGLLLTFSFMHGVADKLVLGIIGKTDDLSLMMVRFLLPVLILILFLITVMLHQMWRRYSHPVVDNAATVAGVAYVSLFLATLVGLRQLFSGDLPMYHYLEHINPLLLANLDSFGAYTVAAILASIWICDSGAYYAGRTLGRHKLFERVSPKKTWEGAIAGALCAVGAMYAMQHWFLTYLSVTDAVVIGVIIGVFGQIGDLAESHLKRDAGIKDSSQLIPGHGGLLDRFDSLLFVSPLVYLYLNVMVVVGGG